MTPEDEKLVRYNVRNAETAERGWVARGVSSERLAALHSNDLSEDERELCLYLLHVTPLLTALDAARALKVPPTVDALLAAQMDAATARAERDALREAARALLDVCTATQPMRDYDDAAARLRALLPEPGQ